MIPRERLREAQERLAPHIRKTPLTHDEERGLYLKWENHQVTGSFKVRGALNKIVSLEDWERQAGLVTASAGNHGQGVALAGRLKGAAVDVFVSNHAVPVKVQAMQDLGARIHLIQGGYAEAEAAGRKYSAEFGKTFVSPYNDPQIIAGQGTMGLEILEELSSSIYMDESVANWIVPTGGGGLISSIGILLETISPRPKLIAVQASASPFTYNLFHRHTQDDVQDLPTLADGLSGAVEDGSITIPMIERYVNDFLLVTEEEIRRSMAFAWYVYHERIEGSAAVGLAAILEGKVKERQSVVIISGGNVQSEVHEKIVAGYGGATWD